MSISNLANTDINSVTIQCTVTGAITGTGQINLKRLGNIVYLSFAIPAQTVGVAGPTITITPNTAIPTQYRPNAGVFRTLSVSNNGQPTLGTATFANTLTPLTVSLFAGGNFAGLAGVVDSLLMWAVQSN
jgi:hypothetical protein